MAIQATEGVRREAMRDPERCSGLAGGTDDVAVNGGSVAVLHVGDADPGCDERCRELRDVVYDDVRRPMLHDRDQVVHAGLQFDPDEELREDEAPDF